MLLLRAAQSHHTVENMTRFVTGRVYYITARVRFFCFVQTVIMLFVQCILLKGWLNRFELSHGNTICRTQYHLHKLKRVLRVHNYFRRFCPALGRFDAIHVTGLKINISVVVSAVYRDKSVLLSKFHWV